MFDINNQYSAAMYGRDRIGHTTPDPDGTELLRPFLPVQYPAPYLPGRRRDDGHPVGAQVVLSAGHLIGTDKSGALIPAGLISGDTGPGGNFMLLKYGQDDVGFAYNPQTGALVQAAGEYALIAAPSGAFGVIADVTAVVTAEPPGLGVAVLTEGAPGAADGIAVGSIISFATVEGVFRVTARAASVPPGTVLVTLDRELPGPVGPVAVSFAAPTIDGVTPTADDQTFAHSCDLVPGGYARPVGFAIRNVWQYLGGVENISLPGGMSYKLNGVIPFRFRVHNYMHEPGTAVQTAFGLRVPYIGADFNTLPDVARAANVVGYSLTDYSKSFVHSRGVLGAGPGKLFRGAALVADSGNGYLGTGNYLPFDPTKHSPDSIIGRVLGIEHMYPIRDFADRVRTQFDRAQSQVGPFSERNTVTHMMGGSATRGLDYAISLSTNGLFRKLIDKGVTNIDPAAATYVWMGIRTI